MAAIFNLENAHLRMRVTPQGGAALSLDALEYAAPVLYPAAGNTPGDGGLFPMLPLANRVTGNRFTLAGNDVQLPQSAVDADFFLHGDGWLACWEVVDQSRERCLMQLRRRHACGFDYRATIDYRLNGPALTIALTLTHMGSRPMLYGGGIHPFFHFTPQSRAQFSASGYWPEGRRHLPLAWRDTLPEEADFATARYGKNAWLNICYSGWNGRATILHPQMHITLHGPAGYLMLYRTPDAPFLCLEPQSHPVNAHNLSGQPGVVMLGQNETWRFASRIAVGQGEEASPS